MALKLANLVALAGTIVTRAVPLAWIEGKHAWPIMFCVFLFLWCLWSIHNYIERHIATPIRELGAAIGKLEKVATDLTCTVGSQSNRVEALTAKMVGNYDHIWKCLKELLTRIPPQPPEKEPEKSAEKSK